MHSQTKIFVSYSRKDLAFVDRLDAALRQRDVEPLIDRADIVAFEDWWERIKALIARADTIVFVLSSEALRPGSVCHKEVAFAQSLNKRLAPIIARPIDGGAVPEELRRLSWISFEDQVQFEASVDALTVALTTDIAWIRKHTDLGEQAWRWATSGAPRGLLLRSPALEEAESWIVTRPFEAPAPTPDTLTFILESRRAALRRRNVLATALAAGLSIALVLSGVALWQRDVALRSQEQANAQRDRALITQSRFLIDLARQQRTAADLGTALSLALEALPDQTTGILRPYIPEAEFELDMTLRSLRELTVLQSGDSFNARVSFSPDGSRLIATSQEYGAFGRVWDSRTLQPLSVAYTERGGVAAVSADGTRILTVSDNRTQLWNSVTAQPIGSPFPVEDGLVVNASFSPDTTRLVTVSRVPKTSPNGDGTTSTVLVLDRIARLWDANTGRLIGQPLAAHTDAIAGAHFSPDSRRLITFSFDSTARLWDAGTGVAIGATLNHASSVTNAVFSLDGTRIVTIGFRDNVAHLWDGAARPVGRLLIGHDAPVTAAAFSPDGRRIVTGSRDKTARVWDSYTGMPIGAPLRGHPDEVSRVDFSPDANRIVTMSAGRTRLWNAITLAAIGDALSGSVNFSIGSAFSPDGHRIVTADGKQVRVWDADTGLPIGEALSGHTFSVASAAFSTDGGKIVSVSSDGTTRIWKAETDQPNDPLIVHGGLRSAALSPGGQHIVTASTDQTARIWDAGTGKPIGNPFRGHTAAVRMAAFSPDSMRIVTASDDKTARLWEAATGKPIAAPLVGHTAPVTSAAFSPDGRRVVTASEDGTARIWDAATGHLIGSPLTGHGDPFYGSTVSSAVFSPDGMRIVTASFDRTARLWDIETGRQIGSPLSAQEGPLQAVAFSPDGRRIATASLDGTVRLWNGATGEPIEAFAALFGAGADSPTAMLSVAFSADARRIITGSLNQQVQIWDAATGQPLAAAFTGHDAGVASVAFSPDGRHAFSASEDGAVRRWALFPDTEAFVQRAKSSAPRCLTPVQRAEYFLPREPPFWCIDQGKWPYNTENWKRWLIDARAGKYAPLPIER